MGSVADIEKRLQRAEEAARACEGELARVQRLETVERLSPVLVHELKQPLAAVSTYARGCLHAIEQGTNGARLREALEAIVAEADRAAELLQGFRDFLGKGKGKRDVVCIEDVARDAIRFGAHEAQLADIRLRLESATALRVQVDRVQIRQVMLNLLWNAFEAVKAKARGTRSVLLKVTPCRATSVQVSVRDTGAGLATDLVPRLFQPFVTTRATGLGMGLFICRKIVESHGGRIWLAGNSSSGATFGFTLPVSGEKRTSVPAHAG